MEIEAGINQLKIEGVKIQIEEGDYDFVEEKPNVYEFNLQITPEYQQQLQLGKIQVKKIIFGMTGHPQAYLQSKVNKNKDLQKIGQMNFTKSKNLALATLFISNSTQDELIVIFNFSIEDEFEFKFSEFFFSQYINTTSLQSVVILECIHQEYIVTSEKKTTPLKKAGLTKFTTTAHINNSLFPLIPQLPVGNRQYGLTADILTYLEINSIHGEVLIITPSEMQLTFTDIQAFEVLRSVYPSLNVDTTVADAKATLQRLNDLLYSSGMFM